MTLKGDVGVAQWEIFASHFTAVGTQIAKRSMWKIWCWWCWDVSRFSRIIKANLRFYLTNRKVFIYLNTASKLEPRYTKTFTALNMYSQSHKLEPALKRLTVIDTRGIYEVDILLAKLSTTHKKQWCLITDRFLRLGTSSLITDRYTWNERVTTEILDKVYQQRKIHNVLERCRESERMLCTSVILSHADFYTYGSRWAKSVYVDYCLWPAPDP